MSADWRDRSGMVGNRNSTPEASSSSAGLRPPPARSAGHPLRASADMSGQSNGPLPDRRPASEVYSYQHHKGQGRDAEGDASDKAAQQWLDDIDSYETMLGDMALATLDHDFKAELSAIEQWFRVLSEAERTSALYALLQQATQVQTRFFIGVLKEMAKNQPVSGVLSPSNYNERDIMSNKLTSAMNRASIGETRNSNAGSQLPTSPAAKRDSGLDQAQINARFPEAAAAIEAKKSDFRQKTGTEPRSNRSSAAIGDRTSLAAVANASAPTDSRNSAAPASPWGPRTGDNQNTNQRPKSSSGQTPMGQFAQQPPGSAGGPRSARPAPIQSDTNVQKTTLDVGGGGGGQNTSGMPMLSPYAPGGTWGSLMSTPMTTSFPNQDSSNQANMVAQATAMKLQALGTANGRVNFNDPQAANRERRARSREPGQQPPSPNPSGTNMPSNFVMTNEMGQVLSPAQAAAAVQAQQMNALNRQQRSRPVSPNLTVPGQGMTLPVNSNHQNYLSAFNGNQGLMNGATGFGASQFGNVRGDGGFPSDFHDVPRGRSPRGKRGTSRPPEDPTDIELLNDIPGWLRSLRLHKYTDQLKKFKWQELVNMSETDLENEGVSAQGARRKLEKVFEQVKEAQSEGKLPK